MIIKLLTVETKLFISEKHCVFKRLKCSRETECATEAHGRLQLIFIAK